MFNYKTFLSTLTEQPGVYRMYDSDEKVIYVGKAKNLKKRVTSYFRQNVGSLKTEALVRNIASIEVIVTHSETEALILEHNLIKLYQPRYNVVLRSDDKTYPYILLTEERHPRLMVYRGAKHTKGHYFGPFPNVSAVRETLALLQKLFKLRLCDNSVYKHRTRPCLQYQIGRCLAPCVNGYVSDEKYHEHVEYVSLFLKGKDQQILDQLVKKMEQASQQLQFEIAASVRDQIQSLRSVIEQQFVSAEKHNLDVIGVAFNRGVASIHVLFIRQGQLLGSRSYFPKIPANTELNEVIETFIGQFYLQGNAQRDLPYEILLDFKLPDLTLLEESLTEFTGHKVTIQNNPRKERAKFLQLAQTNALAALTTKLSEHQTIEQRMDALKQFLKLPDIMCIECFDISHTMGTETVASCVVFDKQGPIRAEYRRYNISGITPGDDYAAMRQVLVRRYSKIKDMDKLPTVIFIDGGKGQLKQAIEVFSTFSHIPQEHKPLLLGIAKGADRKVGLETLFFKAKGEGVALKPDSLALHLIQYVRDESHNHAIMGHRKKRAQASKNSILDQVEGIGIKKRQLLLKYMGGLQPLMNASINDIATVPGISQSLAEKIFHALKQ